MGDDGSRSQPLWRWLHTLGDVFAEFAVFG